MSEIVQAQQGAVTETEEAAAAVGEAAEAAEQGVTAAAEDVAKETTEAVEEAAEDIPKGLVAKIRGQGMYSILNPHAPINAIFGIEPYIIFGFGLILSVIIFIKAAAEDVIIGWLSCFHTQRSDTSTRCMREDQRSPVTVPPLITLQCS